MPFRLRQATDADAEAIAQVYYASFRLLTFLPMLHDIDSYRWYVANVMLKEWAVTIAEDDTGAVAFLGLRGEEVGHCYTRPDRIGRGAGTQLIERHRRAASPRSNCGPSRPTPVPAASTKRVASGRSGSPTARRTRSAPPTAATAGSGLPARWRHPAPMISAHGCVVIAITT